MNKGSDKTLPFGKLSFKPIDIEGKTSISGDLSKEEAIGIYAYEFEDGTWYVGKSIDVRDRHVSHLHEWAKESPSPEPIRMFWASLDCTSEELDYAETQAIADFESKGYSLRNVMKTGRPRGNLEVVVDTGEGYGVAIPWERHRLPGSKRKYEFADSPEKRERFQALAKRGEYDDLRRLLAKYVNETIPAPADTAGSLWVATAMPSTGKDNRLCCISCQNAETLVIMQDVANGRIHGFVNVKRDEEGKLPMWWRRSRVDYGTLPNAYSLYFSSLKDLEKLLTRKRTLDCCYRANAELMRRGATVYKRFNNPYLVKDILDAIPPASV